MTDIISNYDNKDNEDQVLIELYTWLDSIPLSRPKKQTNKDFADGVLLAEVIKHYYPTLVELHNYQSASSTKIKEHNWQTLNRKVLSKLGFTISNKEIKDIISIVPFAIEQVLLKVYNKVTNQSELNISNLNNDKDLSSNINFNKLKEKKSFSKEEIIKNALNEKDRIINELSKTLDSLQFKLKNSEEENKKLEEKINQIQMLIMSKNK